MHNHAFFAKENCSGSRNLVVRGKTRRTRNGGISVMPDEGDRAALFFRWELESNLCPRRIGEAVFDQIIIKHLRANTFRSIQIERPKRRIDHVTEPIADRASAKVHPAAPIPRNPKRGVWTKWHRT